MLTLSHDAFRKTYARSHRRPLVCCCQLAEDKAPPKNVHRVRTTIRRIESLVSYANPDLDKKLERTLEKMADLRKQAGKVRDLDVQVGLLGALANGSTARDRKSLAELLGKKRDRQAAET